MMMNEKLKKFADECGLSVDTVSAPDEIEFFAKQIIIECISIARDHTQFDVANSIAKRFAVGVKIGAV